MSNNSEELRWYKEVYQGDKVPQLTVRAILTGSVIGGLMSLSNLYVGLKTGWGLGVAITSCILSFAFYKSFGKAFPKLFGKEMSILENNCMQSTASSAGYSTGGTITAAVAAYLMVTGHHIPPMTLVLWMFFLAVLGVFMAIPMKRQMINIEQLKFPSGIAAAETLKSLHAQGGDAVIKARSLGISGLLGALITWFRDAGKPFAIPSFASFPGSIMGIPLAKWTIEFEMSLIMIAAGAIMGWKMAWSLLLGGIINYAVLAPQMVKIGAIDPSQLGYRAIVSWSTWAGASIMVASALTHLAFQWKTIVRSMTGLTQIFSKNVLKAEQAELAKIEVPVSWFLLGVLFAGAGCIWLLYTAFNTAIWLGIVAVFMSFFLSLVACRATGESDITPMGAMGKITQLFFGVLAPANMVANLSAATVTGGTAISAADLLTDLKSGYLLGANPRKQFIAQFLGIFAGVAVIVPAFYVLVPDASVLGTDKWPAPSAQVWAAVARLLASGLESLHPTARLGLVIGAIVGVVLPVAELIFPKARRFIPSSMGLGLAMVIPFFNSLSMFIGALIVMILEKKKPLIADRYVIPVSSGIIAGESIMGIIVALLAASGAL